MKQFVSSVSSSFDISPSKTQIAVVVFGINTTIVVEFSKGHTLIAVDEGLDSALKIGGQRDFVKALKHVNTEVFSSQDRDNTKKILVILTENKVYDKTGLSKSITQLKNGGVKVLVVAINGNRNVLNPLASNDDFVSVPKSIDDLPKWLGKVEQDIRGRGKNLGLKIDSLVASFSSFFLISF